MSCVPCTPGLVKVPVYLLCTGASLYAPYSLLLISNKFWRGEGGEPVGEKRGRPSWRGRIRAVEQGD